MAYALRKWYKKNRDYEMPKSFILGSFAPDILLYILVFYSYIYYTIFESMSSSGAFRLMFDTLYFTDPLWIFAYNILHSPFVVIAMICVIYAMLRNNIRLYKEMNKIGKKENVTFEKLQKFFPNVIVVLFFFFGCLFHIAFDIPVHNDDGPLILYPIDMDLRFYSPISYWDPNHYGAEFAIFELAFMIFLVGYLGKDWLMKKLGRQTIK